MARLETNRAGTGDEQRRVHSQESEQLCAARGLTLEHLAERAGVERGTVLKIDARTVPLQPITRRRLVAVLDLAPDTRRDALSAARRRVIPPAPSSQLR